MVIVLYWAGCVLREFIMNELKIFFYTLLTAVIILIILMFLEGASIKASNIDFFILAYVIHLNVRSIFKE